MSSSPIVVDLCGRSDVGLVRASNEDSFAIGNLGSGQTLRPGEPTQVSVAERGPLVIVCDGMGGAAAGEVASQLAVETILAEMVAAPATIDRAVYARQLRSAVRAANRRVWDMSGTDWRLRGMGTTVAAAGLVGQELVVANVGDSRAYVARGGALVQVTRDQSVVSALLHAGRITEAEAKSFSQGNVILQALGVAEDVDVALSIVELRRGDRLLVCSDGLTGPVDDDGIRAALGQERGLGDVVGDLIAHARDGGAPDNVTVVVAAFAGEPLAPPASPEDLPRFIEFDPQEEGERALTTTSRVARRLAARAGVGIDSGPMPIPATGQHAIADGEPEGPAIEAFAEGARIGALSWIMAVVAILAVVALLVFGR
jgi:protein phosphatase